MLRYEYKSIIVKPRGTFNLTIDNNSVDDQMNALGSDGWELLKIESLNIYGCTSAFIYTFKRSI